MRSTFAAAFLAFALATTAQAQTVNCSVASQRDATCVGSTDAYGTHPTDNEMITASTPSTRPSSMTMAPRGSNAIVPPTVAVPVLAAANVCVTVPFVSWAYDPVSFGTPAPSFIAPAGSGYIGSGGASSPTASCASDSDGSCTAWVPADHPYLFLGGNSFTKCTGTSSMGSVSCQASGGSAYLTSNPNAGTAFTAFMVACTGNSSAGLSVLGVQASYWQPCSSSTSCNFYIVYPADNSGGN